MKQLNSLWIILKLDVNEIEESLIDLAVSKINMNSEVAPNFVGFKLSVIQRLRKLLPIITNKTAVANIPLQVELFDLVVHSNINEILTSIRTINNAVNFIIKKMDIYDEFVITHNE